MKEADLNIAEIPHPDGSGVRYRYSRYMSADHSRWIRHGLFVEYFESGAVRSEGEYRHGLEEGIWKDFHESGQLAAKGEYLSGKEHGVWEFFSEDGTCEAENHA